MKGYKLVPVEPTNEMLEEGMNSWALLTAEPEHVWSAMLAAAPTPPTDAHPACYANSKDLEDDGYSHTFTVRSEMPGTGYVDGGFSVPLYTHPKNEIFLPEKYDESQYRGTSLLAVRRWNKCVDEVLRLNSMTAPTPPRPIYDEATERELFEAYHAIASGLEGTDLETEFDRKDDGEYVYMMAADGWKYWKACARAKAGEVDHE